MIDRFDGEHAFLSNFHPSPIFWDGVTWPTAEHMFQAEKTKVFGEKLGIFQATLPGQAKRLGRKVTLRSDWEDTKFDVMVKVVFEKFEQNPDLASLLVATGTRTLIEGNHWGDKTWGVCDGEGLNWLGFILNNERDHQRAKRGQR